MLVHNADYLPKKGVVKKVEHEDGSVTITKKIDGNDIDITYKKGTDGNLHPRFESHTHPNYPAALEVKGMSGVPRRDTPLANAKANLKSYTWHHLEDGKSMLLVDSKVHSVRYGGFTHTGGGSILRNN